MNTKLISKSLSAQLRALRTHSGPNSPASVLVSCPAEPFLELLHTRWARAAAAAASPPVHNIVISSDAHSSALLAARTACEGGFLEAGRVWIAPPATFQRMAGTASPPSTGTIVAEVAWQPEDGALLCPVASSPSPRLVLVLDGVQDPANAASAVRSAAFWGWHGVVLMPGTCHLWRDKVLTGSRLASLAVPWTRVPHTGMAEAVAAMTQHGSHLYATMPPDTHAFDISAAPAQPSVPPPHTVYLAIGNEGHGLSKEVRAAATHSLTLEAGAPAPHQVQAQSLNAAAAAAVCMARLSGAGVHIHRRGASAGPD